MTYAQGVSASVPLRRAGYRVAYRILQSFWFLRRPQIEGVKCLLTSGDHVLLVRHTYGPPVWDLPGGGVKRGEAPLTAARREMAEELGLMDADWRPAGVVTGRQNFRHDTVHGFAAELVSLDLVPNPAELASVRWFLRSALPHGLGLYARAFLPGAEDKSADR